MQGATNYYKNNYQLFSLAIGRQVLHRIAQCRHFGNFWNWIIEKMNPHSLSIDRPGKRHCLYIRSSPNTNILSWPKLHVLSAESHVGRELLTWSNCVLISANSLCEKPAISARLSSQLSSVTACNLPVVQEWFWDHEVTFFGSVTASAVIAHARIPTRSAHAQNDLPGPLVIHM